MSKVGDRHLCFGHAHELTVRDSGIRALKNAAETWGDDDQYYLKAATNFSQEFDGWGGFVEA